MVEAPDRSALPLLVDRAVTHLEKHFLEGSALGLCVTAEDDPGMTRLISFGRRAATGVVSQAEAREAAAGCHLSGHGGTCDGIIGAAAAVGLTAAGWSGRFIEYGGLRSLPSRARVAELEHRGMLVVAVDRDAAVPAPDDEVETQGWLRPRLWGGRVVVPVARSGEQLWTSIGSKDGRNSGSDG